MSETMKKIQNFMEEMGIPGRDGYELPTSAKSFPDGAHWRFEIAGIERASTMEAMIDEAKKRNVTVHRAIACVGGSTYCDFEELKDMAQMAREEKIEVIMTIGHRKAWDAGAKEMATSEGSMQGYRLRGSDNISYYIADMMRNIEAGFRGFLVYDEGALLIINKMREEGMIPKDTIFKFSIFGGNLQSGRCEGGRVYGRKLIQSTVRRVASNFIEHSQGCEHSAGYLHYYRRFLRRHVPGL